MKAADKIKVNNIDCPEKTFIACEHMRYPPIARVPRDKDIPLSYAQQRLWIHDQLEPDTPNNISNAVWIQGHLRLGILQRALDTIVDRHEILRTTYSVASGEPLQTINPACSVPIIHNDLSNCPDDELEGEIRHCISEEARHLFNLSGDLMLRTVLIRLSDTEHVLILTIHQIASDSRSMKIFFMELLAGYGAFSEGKPFPLPELPVQYADFAYWRRQWMTGEVLQHQLSYWQNQLAGGPSFLELPSDRPRPALSNLRGASHTIVLPHTFAASIRSLIEQEGVTMFVMMMAAFKTLLYRYTGQGDVSVGTFLPNRNWPEVHGLIGFFLNTVVLRTCLYDGPSFAALLKREMSVVQEAYEHCDMPFEKLVEVLNPHRDPGHTPLFQTALLFEDVPAIPNEIPDLNFELLDSETSVSLYELSLIITELSGDIRLSFIYRTDLFDAGTIQRMAANFRMLLKSIVSNPDDSIFMLPVLSQSEQEQILGAWNSSKSRAPIGDCIHNLFEAQVERTPDAVALVFEGREMTYRELNSKANQLAHYLIKIGAGPEVLVGIFEERSLEMVVGLLGILKAGGAYVPLDPGYPLERLTLMMVDADVTILLTNSRLSARIPLFRGKPVYIDSDWKDITLESKENPVTQVSPDNAACLLYTSGSTGKPKGAILQHSSLVHFITAVISEYGLVSSDRVLQFASISFDASTEEIYPCLAIGATLVIRTDDMLTDTEFLQKCKEWKLTVLSLPTAYWHILTLNLESEKLSIPDSVRLLIIGGERALPERLAQWQQQVGPRVKILNTYGPTEATVVTTLFDLTHFNPRPDLIRELPLGRPLPGVPVYVLDGHLQPVPIGVPGELHIGGSVLARGYLKRPDITAERFIPDPFSKEPGARLYKTGDIVRYLPDGNIEFKGRVDHQVKIRGFRIELGEIEVFLRQHSAVREAVVIIREDHPGDQRIVVYVLPKDRESFHIREIRDYLIVKLPNYMIPSAFVLLDSVPLTPNNKVDRNALPEPDQFIQRLDCKYIAPRSELEIQLAGIWENVLGVRPVGITDNFFEIGGHSLLAVRLSSEIRKIAGKDFPVMALFHNPTIEQLSRIIINKSSSYKWPAIVKICASGSKIPLFSVYNTHLARFLEPDQPFYILTCPSKDENLDPYDTIEKIAALNIKEMRTVQPKGPYLIIGYCFWAIVTLEMAHQLIKQGDEVPVLFLVEPPDICLEKQSPQNTTFKSRLISHSRNLRMLRYPEKIAYIIRKTLYLIKRNTSYRYIKYAAKIILCKTYLYFGHLPPLWLRRFYLSEYHANKISSSYMPRIYPGKAVIFYADEMSADAEEWSEFVTGGVEIHEVPKAGHLDILREPYISKWAKILGTYLNKIQGNDGRTMHEEIVPVSERILAVTKDSGNDVTVR